MREETPERVPEPPPGARPPASRGSTRRDMLLATGAVVAGGALAWGIPRSLGLTGVPGSAESATPDPAASDAAGSTAANPAGPDSAPIAEADRRAGITHPAVPARHTRVTVYAFDGLAPDAVFDLARAGRAAVGEHPADAGVVTMTGGLGIPLAHALFPDRCERAEGLPPFASDAEGAVRGGDLVTMIAAETVAAVTETQARVTAALGNPRVLWSQTGFRDAPGPAGTTRAGIGFIDGIINPRTPEELRAGVWVGDEGRDTFLAVRRMRIDASFAALSTGRQEDAVGRRKDTGAPLSGGGPLDQIDLLAKNADGRLQVPAGAHARRAHPANIGRALMLRRSYSFDDGTESGLMFVAALGDAETFVLTQRRLDEHDDLLAHAVTTAGDCFFVPEELSAPTRPVS